jgi:putative endonuclease
VRLAAQARGAVSVTTHRIRLGKWGEGVAVRFLQEKGYVLLATNYRCHWGEVDIVAQEGEELVFVEVRTRRGVEFGTPEESVTAAKARKLIATAQEFLQEHDQVNAGWRIDLIAIRLDGDRRVQDITHLRHAVQE